MLYPGSPQPLDPGEEGGHGPWRVEVGPSGRATAQQVPLASVRYDTLEVDVGGVADKAAFRAALLDAVETDAQSQADQDALQRLVYRLRCTGRTALHRELDIYRREIKGEEIPISSQVTATVDTVRLDTQPDVDLEAVAERSDPPGVLAQVILDLKDGDGEAHGELLRQTREQCSQVKRANKYDPLRRAGGSGSTSRDEARSLLIEEGLRLLDQLLAQKAADAHE
jgi:DNA repair exonuclease SbcCD nuclease subunit